MLSHLKSYRNREEGQAMAELALVMPLLILILCGIIDFGWFYSNQLALSYCSREGARYGAVHSDDANIYEDITNRVLTVAPDYIRDKLTVTVTFSDEESYSLGDVTVNIEANINALTPVVGVFEQNDLLTLSSQCVMKVE